MPYVYDLLIEKLLKTTNKTVYNFDKQHKFSLGNHLFAF